MQRITRMHAQLKERVLSACIFNGTSYEGEGVTPAYDYYTAFGVTKKQVGVDLTDATTDPFETLEEARQHIAVNAQDMMTEYQLVMFAGKSYFSKLIQHPIVQAAYQYYSSEQDPLRKRLGGNAINRTFSHKGLFIIEVINDYLDADKAVVMPWVSSNDDMFRLYFAPADDAAMANQPGQELTLLYKEDSFNRSYRLESETSVLAVPVKPEVIVHSTAVLV
jgi:hypothetical protein